MIDKEKSIRQKEILDKLPSRLRYTAQLPVRIGKTKIMIDLIKREKFKKILWVTPSVKLVEEIPKEFEKWKAKSYLKNLVVSTWASLNKINDVFDFIVLDEVQNITENNIANIHKGTLIGKNILGITGTLPKDYNKIELLKNLNLYNILDFKIDEAVDKNLLADYSITVYNIPMSKECDILVEYNGGRGFFKTSEFGSYHYINNKTNLHYEQKGFYRQSDIKQRMFKIYNSPSKLKVAKELAKTLNGRKLFFCSNIKQAEEICDKTYHSKTTKNDLDDFLDEKIDTLSLVNAGGTGVTYKNIDYLIIVQSNSNKNGDITQKIGRALLKQDNYKAKIIILCLKDTQDEVWVKKSLEDFNKDKITIKEWK